MNCRDCEDLHIESVAMRLIGRTPVCDRHMRSRLGMPQIEPEVEVKTEVKTEATTMGKMGKRIDEETRREILKDAAAGMGTNAIAVKHGVGWATAKKVIDGNQPAGGGGGKNGKASSPRRFLRWFGWQLDLHPDHRARHGCSLGISCA